MVPPLRRLSIQPTQLFITAGGSEALAAAQIAGKVFLPLGR